jgi:nickel-dependent lactate racemase
MVPVDREYDIVVTSSSGYPLDQNLYQSVKGMSAASQIVRPGGSIVIAAECRDGVPDHGSFGRLLREARDVGDLLAAARNPDARIDDSWEAHVLGLVLEKAEVWMYSEGLSGEQMRSAKLKPCARVEDAIDSVLRRLGKGTRRQSSSGRGTRGKGTFDTEARICVLPEGPQALPYLANKPV